jgi:hypothetical protein
MSENPKLDRRSFLKKLGIGAGGVVAGAVGGRMIGSRDPNLVAGGKDTEGFVSGGYDFVDSGYYDYEFDQVTPLTRIQKEVGEKLLEVTKQFIAFDAKTGELTVIDEQGTRIGGMSMDIIKENNLKQVDVITGPGQSSLTFVYTTSDPQPSIASIHVARRMQDGKLVVTEAGSLVSFDFPLEQENKK